MPRRNRSDLRDRIKDLLLQTEEHPTAAWVFDRLREEFPRVAIGTVYRNLNVLVSEGVVKNIKFDDPTEHYDANTSKHYHFICEKCGAIRDLPLPVDTQMERKVEDQTGFEIRKHRIDFYGLCDACKQ
ncbi:MAG: Fur family transcriptional regulator [Spirochaetota bacterium]